MPECITNPRYVHRLSRGYVHGRNLCLAILANAAHRKWSQQYNLDTQQDYLAKLCNANAGNTLRTGAPVSYLPTTPTRYSVGDFKKHQ